MIELDVLDFVRRVARDDESGVEYRITHVFGPNGLIVDDSREAVLVLLDDKHFLRRKPYSKNKLI